MRNRMGLTTTPPSIGDSEVRSIFMTGVAVLLALMTVQTCSAQTGWFPLNSGVKTHLWDVAFTSTDSGFVVGGHGTVLRTTDGGVSWISVSIPADTNDNLERIQF